MRLHVVGYEAERIHVQVGRAADQFTVGEWATVDVANMTRQGRVHAVTNLRRVR